MQTDVEKLVNELVQECLDKGYSSAASINNGDCETFAIELAGKINSVANIKLEGRAEVFWDIDLDHDMEQFHCFVLFNDLYYDSECPGGADDFMDLPIYERELIIKK